MLKQKVVIVSGSSRGIGAAIAKGFAASGASVIVNYRHSEVAAREVVKACEKVGGQAIAVGADVATEEGVQLIVEETMLSFGRVDILVNNVFAPYVFDAENRKKAWEMEWQDYKTQLDGSLKAAHLLVQGVLPSMQQFGTGSIINITSNLVAHPVVPYQDYTTAKAAIIGYTRSMAKDLGTVGIRMNAIAPGLVYPTEATKHTKEVLKDELSDATPLGRIAGPDDVVGPVLFLASDWSRFVTGQTIYVDGGLVMK
ncbi:3-oxoacyl-[acyl-carrier-protein] reductase FabG [Oceanobacillus oncorhynchi]|uniref:3-oxoacyl-[acyl-carrier-protein] reductase FabG n=1 Tax=Oceanobacillus oncorhynchi TaxID=545501 RepID=A0A0A1MM57_9BACI|nr:SDR family oxidoreductase [Oceanobacillus oncorhynchi]CEI80894.1 3-oxoacyl-[acyl-carrier-protein] reductase FabG [Oceanobacillus oncorhynchi]